MSLQNVSQSLAEFADVVERAASMAQLEAALLAVVSPLGYVAVASGLLGIDTPAALHFANWPAGWFEFYTQRGFILFDPVPLWAVSTGASVMVAELREALPPEHRGHQIFRDGEAFGLFGGYVVPQRGRDNSVGLVCLVGARDPQTSHERIILRGIAGAVFERAEALSGRPRPARLEALPEISERERECLKCLVQGKNGVETARVMGVSEATVRFHISNLHKKTGVKRRSELVRLAIINSLVRLQE